MPEKILRRVAALTILIAIAAAHAAVPAARAQQQSAAQTVDTYAITNARIHTVSGPVIERGTIVIRDGLISAVGIGTVAPVDARVIDGAGLTIYPGLIDSNTSLGIPATPAPTRGGGGAAGAQTPAISSPNSAQPAGLQPEILAIDFIRPGGDQIEAARNAGITTALSAPREGIFIGQSALINLVGDSPQAMIVRSPVALHVGFTPLRTGGYPASLLGVFSALRQMLLDAGRLREANQIYERNPRGLRRPSQDKSLIALFPALAREMPVVMYADTAREIRRALDLAQEFNLSAIIAGGLESWKVADRLREMNVPVLLSLNFPKRTTAEVPEADPDPLRVMRQRVEAPKTAARLNAARVRFAFQSGSMTSMADFLANANRSIENGLARDEALRAMTIRPAEIFGVANRLGTIEVGKIANLTITRGDIFDKTSRIAHVFIDGRPIDLKPAAATPAAAGAAAAGTGAMASGAWTIKIKSEEGREETATLTLQQEGTRLTGSLQGDLGAAQIAGGSVDASGNMRFTAPVTFGGQTTEAVFTGKITANQMSGTVQTVGRSPATFTGTKPQ
ncbi:MAG: amidohydrolase family protein [Pyrinomonadaceae bacterium]|nr:amidohydrolase family protein [Pyrinomonadaceae bacterium]